MDAIDILGELLGHKTNKPSRGTDILKDIFGRGSKPSTTSPPKSHHDINREARELEELLNVAKDRSTNRNSNRRSETSQPSADRQTPSLPQQNERAVLLIRAMVNAAKADGKIDETEQHKIIEKLGNTSRENIDFLRKEFAAPLNVQEFVQSVPIGMEQQVYTLSLIAIDLDEGEEASYLMQLANGLRIPVEVREQIHQRLGAPSIY